MHLMIVTTLFCNIILTLHISKISAENCPADKEKHWSYNNNFPNGPKHWSETYPGCKGKSQSPINIVKSKLTKAENKQKLKLSGYVVPISELQIQNNGHTIVVTPKDNIRRSLILDYVKYKLHSFHFHWGDSNTKGSEHKIDGKKFELETHFVHKTDDGDIAVAGVLFKKGPNPNAAFDSILSVMQQYMFEGKSYEGTIQGNSTNKYGDNKIHLKDLISNGSPYYRYNGSLTTPPCTENVQWLLNTDQKIISEAQLKKLFSLFSVKKGTKDIKMCHLVNNNRPVQPLNGRKVYV